MSTATSITSRTLSINELTGAERRAMFALLTCFFEGVTSTQFDEDLSQKNHVILLEGPSRELVGFSTLLAYETQFEGGPVSVIYSGDTIVHPQAWKSPVLSRAWITTVNKLRSSFTRGPYYWLLLTSGVRTYRFLPVFWRTFVPHHSEPVSADKQRLLNYLASEKFGPQFDPATGIVRFSAPQRLRADLAKVQENRVADAHIKFFLERNPGHGEGDELVCLTELIPANLTAAGLRMVNRPTE